MKDCVKCRKNQCVNCEGDCGCGNADHEYPIRGMSTLEQAVKHTLLNRSFTPWQRANQAVVHIASAMTLGSGKTFVDIPDMTLTLMERESVTYG